MNKIMYFSRRKMSSDIKAFYPKCINCIHFKIQDQTCKKFLLTGNYINNSSNEMAVNVRKDATKCGEAGNMFEFRQDELNKESKEILNTFFFTSMLTGMTCFITDAAVITLLPFSLNVFSLCLFFNHCNISKKKIENENKRLEEYKRINCLK